MEVPLFKDKFPPAPVYNSPVNRNTYTVPFTKSLDVPQLLAQATVIDSNQIVFDYITTGNYICSLNMSLLQNHLLT